MGGSVIVMKAVTTRQISSTISGDAIAVDAAGNAYIGGNTDGAGLQGTAGTLFPSEIRRREQIVTASVATQRFALACLGPLWLNSVKVRPDLLLYRHPAFWATGSVLLAATIRFPGASAALWRRHLVPNKPPFLEISRRGCSATRTSPSVVFAIAGLHMG